MKKLLNPFVILGVSISIVSSLMFGGIDVSDAATSILGFISVMLFASFIIYLPQNQ